MPCWRMSWLGNWWIPRRYSCPSSQALAQAKQVITIGGDGTLLRIAHDCLAQSKPVLGVNLGRIGFLATCEVAELPEKLARLAAGQYTIEPRNLLRAGCPGP